MIALEGRTAVTIDEAAAWDAAHIIAAALVIPQSRLNRDVKL